LTLGGGEPLLHPDITDIIAHVAAWRRHVALLTNLAVSDDKFLALAEAVKGKRQIKVQVSLDSIDPLVNDLTRGEGKRVMKNIELLLDQGVNPQTATVITKANIDSALDIIDYYYPRIRHYHFMNLMPSYKLTTENRYRELLPDKEELDDFWKRLAEKRKSLPSDVSITDENPNDELVAGQAYQYEGCSAGKTSCDIRSNLDVVACSIANTFVLGNMKDRTLTEVWNSPTAIDIREAEIPLCSSHEYEDSPIGHLETPCGK
jgi:MoaA/NifB/PqqE/SkfB family radical SAM enzyme